MTINIVEIFKSIQGEGPFIGAPAVFVRSHGCNLSCSWCDTKYSWYTNKGEGYTEMSDLVLSAKINSLRSPEDIVVLTGGEPMIWQSQYIDVLRLIKNRKPKTKIHVETNGTTLPLTKFNSYIDEYVVSPKPGFVKKDRDVINQWVEEYNEKTTLKFVVESKHNLEKLSRQYKLNDARLVVFQPERYSASKVPEDQPWQHSQGMYLWKLKELVGWCQEYMEGVNWRVLPQLHYLLWGSKTGV